LGTIQEPAPLIERLAAVFAERAKNRAYQEGAEFRTDLTEAEKIQKTVFIKAPRATHYGSVVRVIDAVKIAGAIPISLQIDDLN
jgi:biopolymer transport protein ExbD